MSGTTTRVMFGGIMSGLVMVMFTASSVALDVETMVGAWTFDEGDGDVAKDISGNGLDADLLGAPAWVDGKFGKALHFEEAGQAAAIPDYEANSPEGTITILTWQYVDSINNQDLFAPEPGPPFDNRTFVHVPWNDGAGDIIHWQYGMPFVDLSERFPLDMLDNWAHLAFTADADAMRIYRDGELLKQGPGTAPFVRAEHGPWHIGGRSTNTFMGKVDEFAVFNVVLSEADINSVMINGIEGAVLSVSPEGRAATTWARLKAGK